MKPSIFILTLIILTTSCKSYFEKSIDIHTAISHYEYQTALNATVKNKFLKKKRNSLLYHLELGRLFHLQGLYKESNIHLNFADDLMDYQSSFTDFATSVIVNSNSKKYRAEEFEKILIHYYKALNYSYLNLTEDALVEVRRMNLKEQELSENKAKKYNNDAFGHLLMGQVYEQAHEYNNAFIAYRNAYEAYTDEFIKLGVLTPTQLKLDLLKTAYLSGLYSEASRYEKEFQIKYSPTKHEFGEVILYWENGQAPYKVEKKYLFFLAGGVGGFYFEDEDKTMQIPFIGNISNANSLTNLSAIRIAMPKYHIIPNYYSENNTSIKINGMETYKNLELAENINQIAQKTLQDRFIKDLGTHLTKLAINQLAQQTIKSDSSEAAQAVGMILEGIGFISERADTRNWQSLPSMINYTRVALTKSDTNIIELTVTNHLNQKETIKIPIVSKGDNLQFYNLFTPGKTPQHFTNQKSQLIDSTNLKTIAP